ncbi:MAG: SpoIIIAH-like family protein [Clostridia bacterium]|nr:SpoIIIAH-like family protein [Clostridia bacterium]
MKIIKKNQLAILVISLMLITAGYLNYDTNYNKQIGKEVSSGLDESINLAALGDAELVSTNVADENKEETNIQNTNVEEKAENLQETGASIENGDYFAKSKLERNVMYSQIISRYQEIINSSNQVPEQKAVAGEEINKINELQNAIMIAENLLTTKGFNDNIIFVNGNSISVIIGKKELATEEIAQIQNIISRELGAEVDNIHISMK